MIRQSLKQYKSTGNNKNNISIVYLFESRLDEFMYVWFRLASKQEEMKITKMYHEEVRTQSLNA